MDLEIVIEGVSELQLANAIKQKIRQVSKDAMCSGEWSVLMSPSEMRGLWDLGLRGPFGHHHVSFPEHTHDLAEVVGEQLQACLERIEGPAGTVAVPGRTTAGPVGRDAGTS